MDHPAPEAGIDLYWLPLGAGGWFVRLNGRVYEAVHALLERRRPLNLYHSALEVRLPGERFVVENSWPIPDLAEAVASPQPLSDAPLQARRLLDLVPSLPADAIHPPPAAAPPAGTPASSPPAARDDLQVLAEVVGGHPRLPKDRGERAAGKRAPVQGDDDRQAPLPCRGLQ